MRSPFGLVYHWFCRVIEVFVYIPGHLKFLHSNLEKRKNYQVQIFSSERNSLRNGVYFQLSRKGKIFKGHLQTNIGLKMNQNHAARSDV